MRFPSYSTIRYFRNALAVGVAVVSAFQGAQSLAAPQDPVLPQELAVSYVGEGTRVSVGKANVGSLRGEISHAFAGDERSAWIGETWFGKQVGGVKLSRHWLQGDADKGPASVSKLFAAWDRNAFGDQKLTLGGGGENETLFWGGYGAFGLTGRRDAGSSTSSRVDTIYGTDPNLGDYTQQLTTTTTVRTFERAYDYGVGARIGHHYQPLLIRLTAGLDHEWGQASSSQTTASLGVEKFFGNSPHSILLNLASASKRGEFETDRHDHRVGLFWRYELGGKSGQLSRAAKTSANATEPLAAGVSSAVGALPADQAVAAASRVLALEIQFDLDKADLRPQARRDLDDLVAAIPAKGADYRLTVTGHTCDVGREAYNQKLSERRAATVRDYLVAAGLSAASIKVDAKGELAPKYPRNKAERYKNRRCELDLVITPAVQPAAVPGALSPAAVPVVTAAASADEPVRRPEWIRRAIYNPVRHKQEVDVYKVKERNITTTAGDRVYLNRAPVAVDDAISWQNSSKPIDALVNDRDPDGDALRVLSVTPGAHGQTSVRADGKIDYVAQSGWEGGDQFTYTISDGKNGGTASARVTIAARVNLPPVAVDDAMSWQNSSKPIDVLANDSDPDGDALRVVSVTPGAHGQTSVRADGKIDYIAQSGWEGGDQFTYTISDGKTGGTASAKVTIAARVNLPPVAVDDSVSWLGSRMPAVIDVLANDSDPDGNTIVVFSVTNGANGTVSIRPDGKVGYMMNPVWNGVRIVDPNWEGTDQFTYTISDGKGGTATAKVTIHIIDP